MNAISELMALLLWPVYVLATVGLFALVGGFIFAGLASNRGLARREERRRRRRQAVKPPTKGPKGGAGNSGAVL